MNALLRCHSTCLSTVTMHCLEMGGEHARPQHIRLMLDCATICAATADLLAHKSLIHNCVCAPCADVCDVREEDCARLREMEEFAVTCQRCAEICRDVACLDHAGILAMASLRPSRR